MLARKGMGRRRKKLGDVRLDNAEEEHKFAWPALRCGAAGPTTCGATTDYLAVIGRLNGSVFPLWDGGVVSNKTSPSFSREEKESMLFLERLPSCDNLTVVGGTGSRWISPLALYICKIS
jgi:hypothetical protein